MVTGIYDPKWKTETFSMSWLTIVRHAQASFHADHYDQLSPLGERQARLLGESWVRQRCTLDEVYVGPRSRQQQTAELVAACYERAALSFPQPIVLQELDEYDLSGILQQLAPELARQDVVFASLLEAQGRGATNRDRERSFQTMFEPLLRHWQMATASRDGVESWLEFSQRVARGLRRMTEQPGRSRRVVAFTSGGFIGVATQRVLGAPDATALEINWRIRNGAVTEFVFSGQRITLDSFNNVAHFAEPDLVTYR
jgi:broad specificity phosphatase PhoE